MKHSLITSLTAALAISASAYIAVLDPISNSADRRFAFTTQITGISVISSKSSPQISLKLLTSAILQPSNTTIIATNSLTPPSLTSNTTNINLSTPLTAIPSLSNLELSGTDATNGTTKIFVIISR